MIEKPNIPKILRRAAKLLEKVGWCQKRSVGIGGERCMARAIIESGHITRGHPSRSIDAVKVHLGVRFVSRWNDAPERTTEEVCEMLRVVAALHDAESTEEAEVAELVAS